MVKITDIIKTTTSAISPGTIFHGPMEGVNHDKFHVIAGVSENRILTCSVLINSRINPFIMRRQNLLNLQVIVRPSEYPFLSHDSFINCCSIFKTQMDVFSSPNYKYVGVLTDEHLKTVQSNIINSGLLTEEDINTFF